MVHKNSITIETGRRISDSPKPHHRKKAFIKLVSNLAICGNSYKLYFSVLVDIVTTFPNILQN